MKAFKLSDILKKGAKLKPHKLDASCPNLQVRIAETIKSQEEVLKLK